LRALKQGHDKYDTTLFAGNGMNEMCNIYAIDLAHRVGTINVA
jgi:hypothetical protein